MGADPQRQRATLRESACSCGRGAAVAASVLATIGLVGVVVVCRPGAIQGAGHLRVAAAPGIDQEPEEILLQQLHHSANSDVAQRHALHTSAGHLFLDRGEYAKAAEHYGHALNLARGRPERVEAQKMLGLANLRSGHLNDAQQFLENAVADCGALETVAHGSASDVSLMDKVVGILQTLGDVRVEKGHISLALQLYQSALKVAESRRNLDEEVLLLADMSEAWARRGNLTEAFSLLQVAEQRLEAGRVSSAGLSDVVVGKVAGFLGGAHQLRGDVPKAMEHFHRALALQEQLRPQHPDLIATRLAMARAIHDQGDTEGAVHAVERVEETLRSGPSEGPDLGRALMLKGDLLRVGTRFQEATAVFEEALLLQADCFRSEDHPDRAVLLNSYGSTLHDAGMAKEALAKYREALEMNLRTVGEVHPETASTYNNLGTLYEDLGDTAQAYEYYSKCLKIQVGTVGTSSLDVANTYNNLATIMFRQGNAEDAAPLLRKALELLDESGVSSSNPSRTIYTDNLREVLAATPSIDPQAGHPDPTLPEGVAVE